MSSEANPHRQPGRREINGIQLWVDDAGAGAPLLCISGLGYSAWCWAELREELLADHRIVVFDNRGTGRSDKPPAPYSIPMLADDAAAVLRSCGLTGAHVLGHSMGGYIALTLALRYPQLVRSLILVGTSAGGAESLPVPEDTQLAWRAAAQLTPEASARQTMPLSFAPDWAQQHPQRFEEYLRRRTEHPTPNEAWLAQFNACVEYVTTGIEPRQIPQPALVIHGHDDRIVPFENGEALAQRLPRAEWLPMAGVGHLPYLEQRESFMKALRSHLQRQGGN